MSKEKILAAAEKLFAEKGFEGTSVRELAQEAEVNIAMVSYYFGSKENLFEALIEQRTTSTRLKLEEVSEQMRATPVEKLDVIIEYYIDLIFANCKFHLMLHRELALKEQKDFHDHILDMIRKNWKVMQKMLVDGQQRNVFKPDVDTEMVIITIFGVINQGCQVNIIKKLFKSKGTASSEKKIQARLKKYLKSLLHDHLLIQPIP